MRATIANFSPMPREHWGVLTIPRPQASAFGEECTFLADDGREFRAVRGRSAGLKTVYRVRAAIGGSESVQGRLVDREHDDRTPFRPHPWVADDVGALVPGFGARRGSFAGKPEDRICDSIHRIDLLDQSAAHQRFRVVRRIPDFGLYFVSWLDVLHDDPVIPWAGKLVWSHRADPQSNCTFDAFMLSAGELITLDFAQRHGIGQPIRVGNQWVRVLNDRPITLNDGAGLPLSGTILGFLSPSVKDGAPDPDDLGSFFVRGMRDLKAGHFGPVAGLAHEWDGHVLAQRNAPRFDIEAIRDVDLQWQAFLASLEVPVGWFAERPDGCTRTPGQTGAQADFGAQKLSQCFAEKDPRFIRRAQYSVQAELFRGLHHYEDDSGEPLDIDRHPQWVTWNLGTHEHPGVSPDRIGKQDAWARPAPGTGWYGYDDQHRSQNTLAAYALLTDDPLIDDHIAHQTTSDLAAYRVRYPTYGVGAARAQGRTIGALAQLATAVDDHTSGRIVDVITQRLGPIVRNPLLRVNGPMRGLAYGSPDGRKPIRDAQGNLGPWLSIWEHGLATVGLYGEHKRDPGNGELAEALRAVCETLVRFGFSEEGGTWWTTDDILWSDGDAPPASFEVTEQDGSKRTVTAPAPYHLHSLSPHMTSNPGTPGVATWTFAGLLVAREVLGGEHELVRERELDRYLEAITGGREARDRVTAEWWAAIRSIIFPTAA